MIGKAAYFSSCSVRLRRPMKIVGKDSFSRPAVHITASGAQGEKPLVVWSKVGKGSRQNRFVSLVEELALRVRARCAR